MGGGFSRGGWGQRIRVQVKRKLRLSPLTGDGRSSFLRGFLGFERAFRPFFELLSAHVFSWREQAGEQAVREVVQPRRKGGWR